MNPRPAAFVAAALAAGLLLSACGSSSDPEEPTASTPAASESASPSDGATPAPDESEGTRIDVTIRGNDISPNAEKVEVELGETVVLDIVSDRAGEFHVHTTPDQEIAFEPGRTEATLTFDRPGLIDVEEHESHKLLVQFEVR